MNLVGIKTDLAAAITAGGYRCYRYPEPKIEVPCVVLDWPERVAYNRSYKGGVEVELVAFLIVSREATEFAHLQLESAVSLVDTTDDVTASMANTSETPGSVALAPIKPIIESATSDHWKADSLYVSEASGFGVFPAGRVEGYGCELRIELETPGVPRS